MQVFKFVKYQKALLWGLVNHGHFGIFDTLGGETFTFIIGMWIQSFLEFGTGKIPYSSLKVHFNSHARHNFFPIHGLAVVVNKNSTIRRFAAHGGIFFHHAC